MYCSDIDFQACTIPHSEQCILHKKKRNEMNETERNQKRKAGRATYIGSFAATRPSRRHPRFRFHFPWRPSINTIDWSIHGLVCSIRSLRYPFEDSEISLRALGRPLALRGHWTRHLARSWLVRACKEIFRGPGGTSSALLRSNRAARRRF